MATKVNSAKWLSMVINGEKVYKLYEYNGLRYKIIRFEPECTWLERKAGKWCAEFIIHEITESEFLTLLYQMQKARYKPYLNLYNERVVRYLNRNYFPYGETEEGGININKLLKQAKTDHRFVHSFNGEDI